MSSSKRVFATAIGCWLGVWLAVSAVHANNDNEVTIIAASPPTSVGGDDTHHGYYEHRFHLINRSKDQEKRVTLSLPAQVYSRNGNYISNISRRVVLAPGASMDVSLFQPPLSLSYGSSVSAVVNGTRREITANFANHGPSDHYFGSPTQTTRVLVSKTLGATFYAQASSALSITPSGTSSHTVYHSSSTSEFGVFVSEVGIDQWSVQWLSYSRYDGVALGAADLKVAPPGVLEALRQYVAVGGTLMVLGDWQPPRDWQAKQDSGSSPEMSEYYLGFGVCVTSNTNDLSAIEISQWERMQEHWNHTSVPFQYNREASQANTEFPVIEKVTIPVKGLLALMIGFAVLIGPVNLYWLERKRRRIWLLWTVPLISMLFCAAIWVYAMSAEGWTGTERTAGITILDQQHQRAVTLGWTAYYMPLTPSGGLHYSRDTELTPQIGSNHYSYGNEGRSRTIDWTDHQQLATGWVVSRVPAHFLVRKPSVTVRERINFKRESDGSLSIVNGLGASVDKIYYKDLQGNVYESSDVAAGQAVKLTRLTLPSNPSASSGSTEAGVDTGADEGTKVNPALDTEQALASVDPAAWRRIYQRNWIHSFGHLDHQFVIRSAELLPGTYMARLAENPFIESGVTARSKRKASAVVIGIVGEIE